MKTKQISAFLLTISLGICGLLIPILKAQSAGTATSNSSVPKKAEEQFKNIQVLKGIPADQLIPAMQFISASLGVECEFCHVQGAFEKDDKKPKQTARKMIEMMTAINQQNFDGRREVTCYSCHHGSNEPAGTPIVASEEVKEVAPASAPRGREAETLEDKDTPTAAQLFDKYLQAVGGSSALEKITSRVEKGTINFGGHEFPIDIYSKAPEQRASFAHMPEGDNVTAFDGHVGWLGAPGRPVREMHGPDLDGAAMDADLQFAVHLKQMFSQSEVRGTEKIGDREAYLVLGKRQDKPPLRLYFDQQSGLLVRLVRYGETPLGRLPTQIDYADYRNAGGLKVPYRWTLARPSGRFTIQINEVKENAPVENAKFAKPPSPPDSAAPAKP